MEILLFCLSVLFLIWITCIAIDNVIINRNKRPEPSHIPVPPKFKPILIGKFHRLTIKTIIRWEQMRKKSFSQVDYTDKEDVESLLYTMYITSDNKPGYTFEVFRGVLADERFINAMSYDLGRIMEIVDQFQKKTTISGIGNAEGRPEYIGSIVSTLIMAGLDAHYAMNEMELCDLPMYIGSYEKMRKEEMESNRLWTFFTMMPHIDAKKMKNGDKDLIIFPWEEEEAKIEAERAINEGMERFENFMNTKKSDYYGK